MHQRCSNHKHKQYADYGGRGIFVCDRWSDFSAFLADMGERPSGKTLDRINVDGPYSPENCRWATQAEQAINKRPRVKHSHVLRILAAAREVTAANDNDVGARIIDLRAAIDAYDKRAA